MRERFDGNSVNISTLQMQITNLQIELGQALAFGSTAEAANIRASIAKAETEVADARLQVEPLRLGALLEARDELKAALESSTAEAERVYALLKPAQDAAEEALRKAVAAEHERTSVVTAWQSADSQRGRALVALRRFSQDNEQDIAVAAQRLGAPSVEMPNDNGKHPDAISQRSGSEKEKLAKSLGLA
jgi:chromosome segregation ATPase